MPTKPFVITRSHERLGAIAAFTHVSGALLAHFAVPDALEGKLGLVADPWFRMETGTANAGYSYGAIRLYQGHRDPTFLRATAIAGLSMAAVRSVATLHGKRSGPLSHLVIASDLVLGLGAVAMAHLMDREDDGQASWLQRYVTTSALAHQAQS